MILQPVSRMRNEFSDSLNRVVYQNERIILERHGKPIAAILPYEEFQRVKPYLIDSPYDLLPADGRSGPGPEQA